MHKFSWLALASTLATFSRAQTPTPAPSITSIFLPFADQQALVASVISQSQDVATLLLQCPNTAQADDCGFPSALTLTVGPSTLHLRPTGVYEQILGEIDCRITDSTEAVCDLTSGIYDSSSPATATDDAGEYSTPSASSSITTRQTLSGSEVADAYIAITVTATAAPEANSTSSATASASASTSAPSSGSTNSAAAARYSTSSSILALSGTAVMAILLLSVLL